MAIKTVGVLGCGLMGAGIAQVSAASGYKTIVREVNQGALDKGLGRIKKFLDGGVEKGKVTAEQRDTTLGNLSGVTDLGAMGSCDLIIEAIIENLDEKAGGLSGARPGRGRPRDLHVEHLIALHHRAGRHDQAAGSIRRAALLQSGAADEARGSGARR